jgi:steroid 5-alpha reductase family enzyme
VCTTIWGARLTTNFYLKGGFSGGEDYRWAEIRSWPGFSRGWELFNFVFICFFQQLVVLAFSSPAAAALRSSVPLNALDAFAALLYLSLVAGETIADWQMMTYQTEKYRRIKAGEPAGPYASGFIETGLWAFSRHPNYFCEVSLWWAFYLFSIAAGEPLLNWTVIGPFFLSCLFVLPRASLDVTEALSSRKYPKYADYQRTVSRFFPLPPRPAAEPSPMSLFDRFLVVWFVIGIGITYLIDIEQVLVTSPAQYGQPGYTPIWPPAPFVHAVHWWGTWDHLVMARPAWYRAAIWLEVLVQAPFYALALEAWARRRDSIRIPAIVYATVLLTIMPMILTEQLYGPHATHHPALILGVYGPYVVMPILILWRVRSPLVFPRGAPAAREKGASPPAKESRPRPATPDRGSASAGKVRRRATSPKKR